MQSTTTQPYPPSGMSGSSSSISSGWAEGEGVEPSSLEGGDSGRVLGAGGPARPCSRALLSEVGVEDIIGARRRAMASRDTEDLEGTECYMLSESLRLDTLDMSASVVELQMSRTRRPFVHDRRLVTAGKIRHKNCIT